VSFVVRIDLPKALPSSIVITGANGQLGQALLARLARLANEGHRSIRALVRSERARDTLASLDLPHPPEVQVVDYTSPSELEAALAGSEAAVHLVGIIKEAPGTRYFEAHEQTCHALALAANRTEVSRIVYLSILGSTPRSPNACLASKGRAENLLLDDRVAATVLRVPMVLGGDDPASASLRRQAKSRRVRLVAGGRTLQQPIDARDVVSAILSACASPDPGDLSLDAGGPECLSHRDLVLRAARLWDNEPVISSLPIGLARAGVDLLGKILSNPPVSGAMFDILQHDDRVDPALLRDALGIELTPLDRTLSDHVGPRRETEGERSA
jgi:NADH dehydrogenase